MRKTRVLYRGERQDAKRLWVWEQDTEVGSAHGTEPQALGRQRADLEGRGSGWRQHTVLLPGAA